MNNPARRQEDLFERALALPATEREAMLDRECGPDGALRGQVEGLLRANENARDFMESPPTDLGRSAPAFDLPVEEKPGDRIGRYKLLQKIGEGGCGVVYMAEQEEAVRRRVALKVIKLGMDTKSVIARFEAERQALARMEHPSIARVLDGGTTAFGRPFFVMELVRGVRITEYCDQNNLSTEQRLDLFIKVCHAIQHAHQKGIIHRDIKPSNILVTLHDGEPVPKVIDFGIAKATQGRLTEQTLFTAFDQFIGTPAYVSPEQAEMSSLDVDTRSDIYSLGVLLYELLTGRTPFETKELVESGIDEMRRRIREQEPPRPSARLRTLNDSDRTTVARRRGTDASRLALRLRGDLDWIVMRCLEKDRARRYETANGLAMDIQRHLNFEPVSARSPSTTYLMQKLIRRHRFAFGAGAAITAALAAGFAASTILFLRQRETLERAREAEAKALRAKEGADVARVNEAQQRKMAEAESIHREQIARVLTGNVRDISLLVAMGSDNRILRSILEQTETRKKELKDQPELEAGIDETLGGAYFKMSDYARAEELFLEALVLRKAQGDTSPAAAKDTPEIAMSLKNLGLVYSAQSRWDDAERQYKAALEIQQDLFEPGNLEIARTHSTLGWVLAQQAQLTEAEHHLRLALAQLRKIHGPAHADIAATLTRLGSVLTQDSRLPDAERNLREALAINTDLFGRDSLEVAGSMTFLVVALTIQLKLPDAIKVYRDSLDIRNRLNNPNAPPAPATRRPGAIGGQGATRAPRAGATADESPTTLEASLTQRSSIFAELESALREVQRTGLLPYAKDSWDEAFYSALTVWVLLERHKFEEAEPIARQCLQIRQRLRPDDWGTYHVSHMLGAAMAGRKLVPFAEAETLLVEGYNGMKARVASMPPMHKPRVGESALRIKAIYADLDQSAKAAKWQAEFDGLDADQKESLLSPPPQAPAPTPR